MVMLEGVLVILTVVTLKLSSCCHCWRIRTKIQEGRPHQHDLISPHYRSGVKGKLVMEG